MRASRLRQFFCLAVVCALVLVAFHSHSAIDLSGDSEPISGSHHCLVCITAHLPLLVTSQATFAPAVSAPTATLSAVPADGIHDPLLPFSVHMRPPPPAI